MLSRAIAILLASFLPTAALIFPLGTAHRISAIVSGTLAMLLAPLSMAYDRVRFWAAAVGVWVALTAFIFPSTLLEEVLTVCWGTMMFTAIAGPFSQPPRHFRTTPLRPAEVLPEEQAHSIAA